MAFLYEVNPNDSSIMTWIDILFCKYAGQRTYWDAFVVLMMYATWLDV